MPIPPVSTPVTQITTRDLITDAMMEIGVLAAGELPDPTDAAWGVRKLNRVLGQFRTQRLYVPSFTFAQFTLTPNHQPHTIGPNGDFVVADVPVDIQSANLVITTSTPPFNQDICIEDAEWWAGLSNPALTSTFPTSLYYSRGNPVGSIYLYPVPDSALTIELQLRDVLGDVTLDETLGLLDGYSDAIIYSLAESLAPSFERPITPELAALALSARGNIAILNASQMTICGADASLPTESGSATSYRDFVAGRR
jgi:hypothetical protein